MLVRASAKPLRHCSRRGRRDSSRFVPVIFCALACADLVSCAVGPDYQPPESPLPAKFAAMSSLKGLGDHNANRALETTKWWRTLHDRELDSLVERAIGANPTLEIALDRLQQARAQEAVVIGAALPAAEFAAGGGWGTGTDLSRGRVSQVLRSAENPAGVGQVVNLVGFDAAWEIDVFGKYRRAIEAAQYDVDAAIAARNVVLVALIADVTRAYLDLRALQMQLAVLRKNIEVAQKYLDFVQERFSRGITNELDVTLAQRELGQFQAQLAPLTAQIDAARYVVAILIGEFPENLGSEKSRACFPSYRTASALVCRSIFCGGGPTSWKPNASWRAPPHRSAWPRPICFRKWRWRLPPDARPVSRPSSSVRSGQSVPHLVRRFWTSADWTPLWKGPTTAAASSSLRISERC